MSSRATNGWKRLGSFTRAAYGNVNNNLKVLEEADVKTKATFPSNNSTSKLEGKIKTLNYQVKQLNERVVNLRNENWNLKKKIDQYNQEPKKKLAGKYLLSIKRLNGDDLLFLGKLPIILEDGKISKADEESDFVDDYLPSRIVGTYQPNGDFELSIIANLIREGSSYERKTLSISGNLHKGLELQAQSNYHNVFFNVSSEPSRGHELIVSANEEELERTKKKLSSTIKELVQTKDKLKEVRQLLDKNKKSAALISKDQYNKIKSLEKEIDALKSELNEMMESTSSDQVSDLKARNSKLFVENVSLKEQLANQTSADVNGGIDLPFNFCVSTSIKHSYAVAANEKCIRPYILIDGGDFNEFASASGINDIGTAPWVSTANWSKEEVYSVQALLVKGGVSKPKPDGVFGPNTSKSVQKYLDQKGYKLVSGALYLTKDANTALLNKAKIVGVEDKLAVAKTSNESEQIAGYEKQLESLKSKLQVSDNKSKKMANTLSKKDGLIKSLETELSLLKEDTSQQSSSSAQRVNKLKKQVADLQGQYKKQSNVYELEVQKLNKLVANLNEQLAQSKRAADKHLASVKSQEQEIKRLNGDLAVAQEKIKKIRPTESSFMDNISDDWKPYTSDMPLTERLFCDLYHNFNIKKSKAIQSNNQIQVNMVHRAFQEDLDSLIPGGELDQWIVKILKVSQVSGGDAAIIAELPCGVLVGSGIMTVEEGAQDQLHWAATIPYNSRLFNEIAKVGIGDFVNVSGTFVQVKAFKSGLNETYYASNSIGKNPLVEELGLDTDLYLLDLAYFMMLR